MRNGPIAKPNFSSALSTCCGVQPSSSRKPAWRLYCSIMRLPMKPSHTPETTAVFLIFLASAIDGGQHVLGGLLAAHDFQQLHHVGRAEEVQADHVLRALGEAGDLVDVERGGVGGEDGARLHTSSSVLNTCLLHAHVLEHGLDHEVGVRRCRRSPAWCSSRPMRCVELVLRELALLDLGFVVLADRGRGRGPAPPASSRGASPGCRR